MGQTKIEWTASLRADGTLAPGYTLNLWHGCTKVHEGCDHCYAEVLSHRWGNDVWGNDKPRKSILSAFDDLNKYQNAAKKAGEVHRVFVGSMIGKIDFEWKGMHQNQWQIVALCQQWGVDYSPKTT